MLFSNIQAEQSYNHASHGESQARNMRSLTKMAVASVLTTFS